ncbi:MAG: hypothetical protein ACOC53_08525 [Candidatus Saliniplasma sp.]
MSEEYDMDIFMNGPTATLHFENDNTVIEFYLDEEDIRKLKKELNSMLV